MDAADNDGDAMAVDAWMARSESEPPGALAFVAELPRALWTLACAAVDWPTRDANQGMGDARPVMILPGLFNTDRANLPMRRFLRSRGYRAYPWMLGRNRGARTVGIEAERLIERVEAVASESGEKVTLIGISLGGIMARIVAHRRPDLVREVITVSAPFAGAPTATNLWRAFELLTGERIDDPLVRARSAEAAAPPLVPTTAIWSRSDGLVNGLICHDCNCQSVEVTSSHLGVHMKPEVWRAIGSILAGH